MQYGVFLIEWCVIYAYGSEFVSMWKKGSKITGKKAPLIAFGLWIVFMVLFLVWPIVQLFDLAIFIDVANVMNSQIYGTTTINGTALSTCWNYLVDKSASVYFLLLSVLWTCGIGTLLFMITILAAIIVTLSTLTDWVFAIFLNIALFAALIDCFLFVDVLVFTVHQDWSELTHDDNHKYYWMLYLYLSILIIYSASCIGGILQWITSIFVYKKQSASYFCRFVTLIAYYTRTLITFVIHPLYISLSICIFVVLKVILHSDSYDYDFSALDNTSQTFVIWNFAHAVLNGVVFGTLAITAKNYTDKERHLHITTALSVLSCRVVYGTCFWAIGSIETNKDGTKVIIVKNQDIKKINKMYHAMF